MNIRETTDHFLLLGGRLAVDFANTVRSPAGPEGSISSWSDLVDFLLATGGVEERVAERLVALGRTEPERAAGALRVALELRDFMRAALAALEARRPMRPQWVEALNQLLRHAGGPDVLVPDGQGWRLAQARPLHDPLAALLPIARSMALLIAEGPGVPARKCANPRCVLFFYDLSRTRRRRWCAMALCGNRMKVAAHARRRAWTRLA